MKNTFYIASAFAALLAIGCNKSEQPAGTPETPAEESGIVLYAQDINAIGSKTTTTEENGKFTVNWVNGDQLAVYTVPAGFIAASPDDSGATKEWQTNYPVCFTTNGSTAANGLRKFVLYETDETKLAKFNENYEAGNLDWYAIYPYTMGTPSHSGKGMVGFGYTENGNPIAVQNGNDNMEHLSKIDALFGKVTNTKTPEIQMLHIGTLMEFTVCNKTDDPFSVKSITIETPTGTVIAGQFRLHMTEEPFFVASDVRNETNICALTVSDGEPLAKDASAKFYQILAPFHIEAGKDVTITITTDKGFWSKTMTATGKGLDFAAGAKSSANLNVDALEMEKEEIATKQVILGFCNNAGGNIDTPLLSITGCKTYTIAAGTQNQSQIDIVAWHKKLITLGAPNYQWMPYSDVTKWTVRNGTLFKRANISQSDFDGFTKYSSIVKAYDNATDGFDMFQINEGKDNYVFVKTASGQYAVIRIDSLNNKTLGDSQDKYESVTLTVKYANQE